jgi:hypothetical protein
MRPSGSSRPGWQGISQWVDDKTTDLLLGIVAAPDEMETLRAQATIALGPVLEIADMEMADTGDFDDPDMVPITQKSFLNVKDRLHRLYLDETLPKLVRRRILEAAVRAPEPWQSDAICAAYSSGDRDWMLTAVFAMRHVRGFDDQIMQALQSQDADIHYEAVEAAGTWGVSAAWSHIAALATNPSAEKSLRLAAISGVGDIEHAEAPGLLAELADSDDQEISEAAQEAMDMAELVAEDEDDEEDGEGEWVN